MKHLLWVGIVFGLLQAGAATAQPVKINKDDVVVIYGDSITEQNLYAAYVETFLRTRFADKNLTVYNFGWGGDTAGGGNARFTRDVAPVKPTLVFVNFGMNDGGYSAFNQGNCDGYIGNQRALAATIKAAGAREVLLTTSPVDNEIRKSDMYNDTLARMADGVIGLAKELDIPVIDQFHPMRDVQKTAKEKQPGFTMIPDSVHPNAIGHLVMAYEILKGIDAPASVGSIQIVGDKADVQGVKIANLTVKNSNTSFDLTLPFIPFYIPADARTALTMVPFQKELNALMLTVKGLDEHAGYLVTVDGQEGDTYSAAQLADGVDIATMDNATWTTQGKAIWDAALLRWTRHFDAWRTLGFRNDEMAKLPAFAKMVTSQRDFVHELDGYMQTLAQPKTYQVSLVKVKPAIFTTLEFSPTYPFAKEDFAKQYPPETTPDQVAWQVVPFNKGLFDLSAMTHNGTDCAIYARAKVSADADCQVTFSMGSDDGLVVLLDGKRVWERDVYRANMPGSDVFTVEMSKGEHTLLFRVDQGNGGFGLSVAAKALGDANVVQVK